MQLRQAQLDPDHPHPTCHVSPSHRVHSHGHYLRLANFLLNAVAAYIKIPRWLCVTCRRTFSVLPDGVLPYRQISVQDLEEHLDSQSKATSPAPTGEIKKGCLKRAWRRFTLRLAAHTVGLGQLMQRNELADAKLFWLGLRRLGNLQEILRRLSADFQTSLLLDYQCILPWPGPPDHAYF